MRIGRKAFWREDDLRKTFSWLTRVGVGVKFGSRPIGWYQQHQMCAIEEIEKVAATHGVGESFEVAARRGEILVKKPGFGWVAVGTIQNIFAAADRCARR